jgi:crotonobetaine/carnitine-CoA ligase
MQTGEAGSAPTEGTTQKPTGAGSLGCGAMVPSTSDEAILTTFQMHGQDVPRLLSRCAEVRPDHPALVWAPRTGPARTWTYAELQADVHRLASGLAARDIAKGDHVLIHSENCPEMVLAWLACGAVGAVAVTTNTKSVAAEMEFFAEQTQAVAAITQPQYAELVAKAAPGLRWIAVTADNSGEPASAEEARAAQAHDAFDDLLGQAAQWAGRPAEPMLPFTIMFTSGTTSRPKAVVHTHANAVWASRVGPRNIDLGSDDRYVVFLPFFHTNAQTWSFLPCLGVGATVVLMPKWSQSRFWPVVQEHAVTYTSLMPFVFAELMRADKPAEHSLKAGVFGFVSAQFEKAMGIRIYGAYGMTETVTHAISGKPSDHLPERSMGRPTPGYEVAIVDKETGELCVDGTPGELWLRGTRGIQLFREYHRNPDANAKAFQDGWFKTGDIVRVTEDGNIVYQERDKDLLKVGGENVSAKQVEDLIVTHPAVASVAVVGKAHDFLGEVAVAFVIRAPGEHDEARVADEIVAMCTEQLATFKVPRAVYFVDAFPTGTLDKILKNELRVMADARPAVA